MYILFVILPYPSHLLAAFDLAKNYNEDKRIVIFTGELRHKELIENAGFVFEELCYAEEYKVTNLNVFLAFLIQSLFGKGLKIARNKTLYAVSLALRKLISKYDVQQIFIDEYISDYYFLINNYQKVSLVNTRPSTKKVKGVPPLNSLFVPTGGFFSNLMCEWLWFKHLNKRKMNETIKRIAFWGVDEKFLLHRVAQKNGKNYYREINNKHCLDPSINYILTHNLSPEFFEFPFRKPQKNEVFFFEKIVRNESQNFDEGYAKLLEHIQQKRMQGSKVVYVSFGTLSTTNLQEALTFFEKLNSVAREIKNVELIISNKQFSPKNEAPNVQVFPFIPQVDFLKHVDLMINHGGIGSIKECLQAKVKMLSYPLNPKTDQKGCAVRVEALGFGLKGDVKKDSKEDIKRKIKHLLDI